MSAIVLFDGVCNFCNGFVNFVIERDKAGYFKFAPLQSQIGQQLLSKYEVGFVETDSIVLIENDYFYLYSTAALRIAKRLDGNWSIAYAFIVMPEFIRDALYKSFAKNRYRLFGKEEECMIPTPDVRARFL